MDEPQGGYDVKCWRTTDGVGHRFDDDTYDGDNSNALDNSIDCMTRIVKEARRDAA